MSSTYTITQVCEVLQMGKNKLYRFVSVLRDYFPGLQRGAKNKLLFSKQDLEFLTKVLHLENSGMPLREIEATFAKQARPVSETQNSGSLVPVSASYKTLQNLEQRNIHLENKVDHLEKKLDILNEQNRILYKNLQEMRRTMENQMSLSRNMIRRSIELMAERDPAAQLLVKAKAKQPHSKCSRGFFRSLWVHLFQPELLREPQG